MAQRKEMISRKGLKKITSEITKVMEEENLSHVWPIVEGLTKNRSKKHAKAEIEKLEKEHRKNIV